MCAVRVGPAWCRNANANAIQPEVYTEEEARAATACNDGKFNVFTLLTAIHCTSVANSIHAMLVTPQKINYNCSVGVAYFTLVYVEEDIDTTSVLQL